MTEIGTLEIKIELKGGDDVKRGLKEIDAEGHKMGGGGMGAAMAGLNKFRWAALAVKLALDQVKNAMNLFINIAKIEFKFVKGAIMNLIVNPLKTALKVALEAGVAFGAIAISFGVSAVKEFGSFEAELINVRKTTGMTAEEVKLLGDEISKLSLNSQTSAIDLGKIAAAAGQLGIRGEENILGFVDAIDKISIATTVTAEQAANVFGRMAEMLGLEKTKETFMSMGDVINELSNTTAADASDIVNALSNLGNTARVLGVDFKDQAALVATAISTGFLPPKRAGTSIRRFFEQIVSKTAKVGKIMGITADQVKKHISEDAVGFMHDFLVSVNASGNQAEILATMMDINGAKAAQAANAFLMNWGAVKKSLKTVNYQWEVGGGLIKEFGFQMEGLNALIDKASNYWAFLKKEIGEVISPHIKDSLDEFESVFISMIKPLKEIAGFLSTEFFSALRSIISSMDELISSEATKKFINDFKVGFTSAKEFIIGFGNVINTVFQEILPSAINIAKTYVNGLFAFFEGTNISGSIYFLVDAFKKLSASLSGEAFGAVKGVFSSLGEIIAVAAVKVNEFFTALTDDSKGSSALTKILKNVSGFFTSITSGMEKLDIKGIVNLFVQLSGIFFRLAQRANVWIAILLNFFTSPGVLSALESVGNAILDIAGSLALLGGAAITVFGAIYKIIEIRVLKPFYELFKVIKSIVGLVSGKLSWSEFLEGNADVGVEGIAEKSVGSTDASEDMLTASQIESKTNEEFKQIVDIFGQDSISASTEMSLASETMGVAALVQGKAAKDLKDAAQIIKDALGKGAEGEEQASVLEEKDGGGMVIPSSKGAIGKKAYDALSPQDQMRYDATIGSKSWIGDTDVTEHVRKGGIISKRDTYIREAYERKSKRDTDATQEGRDMLRPTKSLQEKGDAVMEDITFNNAIFKSTDMNLELMDVSK